MLSYRNDKGSSFKKFMKKIALTICCTLCSTFALAQNTPETKQQPETSPEIQAESVANASTIRITTRPEILGLWGMEIPPNQQCVEYYNFRGSNEVVIKSDQEWSLGQYQYQVPNNRSEQLPALIFHIKYDNNEKDCSGVQEDQTGEIQQFFVKWVNPQQIQFCGSDKGDNCFATLNKQLP